VGFCILNSSALIKLGQIVRIFSVLPCGIVTLNATLLMLSSILCMNFKSTLYKEYAEIYTDGSKINDRTGCPYVVNETLYKFWLTRYTSVLSAELFAILKSLEYVKVS